MRKVLVTGGGGYVGAALVPALLGAGYGLLRNSHVRIDVLQLRQ